MKSKDCLNESTLSSYLDGELAREAAAEVEKHLSDCSKCEATYQAFRRVDELLSHEISNLDPPQSIRYKLESRIREYNNQPPSWGRAVWNRLLQSGFPYLGAKVWVPVTGLLIAVALALSHFHFQSVSEKQRLLSEIERFKVEMVTEASARNPFDLDGKALEVKAENPFQTYLNTK